MPGFLEEGKDSLGESFLDAKDDLASGTSVGTYNRETFQATPEVGKTQSMETEGAHLNRKWKTTDSGGSIAPKVAR